MADQALPLQLGQRGERRLDRALARPVAVAHHAQIDDLQRVDAQVAQVVVHRARQLGGRHAPGSTRRPRRARAPTLVTITRSSG